MAARSRYPNQPRGWHRPATMNTVPNRRRLAGARLARHLAAVPDEQPAMWEAGDLLRLGQLRKLAVDTGQPDEALHILDAAQTADDAMDALTAAGLIPSGEQSAEEVLSWFSPLLEPGCDQLDAEMCAAEFIGSIRQASHGEDLVPELLCDLIATAAAHDRAESAVMLRTLAVIGPNESRAASAAAIAARPAAELAGLPWTEELGRPVPGRAFGYTDIYDEQTSLVLTFAYGRKRHAVVVLIDYLLGGGIKDCYVVDYTESLRAKYRKVARDPELTFTDYSLPDAASLLFTSLSRPPCPQEPDQVECVQHNLDLVWARADLIIGQVLPPAASRQPRKPAAAPRNIHRIKVTLRGVRPPVWRRFEVPSDLSLTRLHDVIQAGFGWQNCHLFVFETPLGRYGIPDPDSGDRSAAHKKLSAVADWPGDIFRYEYDFGDSWEHDILVEAIQPAEPGVRYPRCTAGRRAGPPEDCGGVWGYAHLLSVLASPRHPEHAGRLKWLGLQSPADFDPARFDLAEVNGTLARIAKVLMKP